MLAEQSPTVCYEVAGAKAIFSLLAQCLRRFVGKHVMTRGWFTKAGGIMELVGAPEVGKELTERQQA